MKNRNRSGSTKRKKMTIGAWKKKLWPVFASWIKERDGYQCFTCRKQLEPRTTNCQAGHFIPKSTCGLGLYFDEMNVHCQCYHCNINLGGYGAMYAKRMEEVYGRELVEALWRKKENITKDLPWEELWERYNNHSSK